MDNGLEIGPKIPGHPESAILDKEKVSPDNLGECFLSMHPFRFAKIVEDLRNEPMLAINLSWADLDNREKATNIRRLNEFLAGTDMQYHKKAESEPREQKRRVIIRGTKEEYNQASKFFTFNNDNLVWEEIESKRGAF